MTLLQFVAYLEANEINFSQDDAVGIFQLLDSNQNGLVSEDDFVAAL